MLLITGVLLIFANNARSGDKEVNYLRAFIIGISQAIAILPGISRSGATISTSLLLGMNRETGCPLFVPDGGAFDFWKNRKGYIWMAPLT